MLQLGLWARMLKCHICNQHPPICLQSFIQKLEFLNLESKMPYLGVLDSNFEKPSSYLKSEAYSLPYGKVWCKKQKSLNLGLKTSDLHILGLENIIVIFEISIIDFALLESLVRKQNPSILDQKCVAWVILGWNLKTISSYLKSAPSNLANHKIFPKTKMTKFGTKNILFGYFWASI